MAAADDVDSAPCNDMEQSKVKTQLESTSEITHNIDPGKPAAEVSQT